MCAATTPAAAGAWSAAAAASNNNDSVASGGDDDSEGGDGGGACGDDEMGSDAEGVWSPDIEQSFQEALAIYPPCGRRKIILSDEGKMYGRNELIARYIKLRTGKSRSRKQVSSHIQVLARRKTKDIQNQLKACVTVDQASKDKALQSLGAMSSAQIVSATASRPSMPMAGHHPSMVPPTAGPSSGYSCPPSPLWPSQGGPGGPVPDHMRNWPSMPPPAGQLDHELSGNIALALLSREGFRVCRDSMKPYAPYQPPTSVAATAMMKQVKPSHVAPPQQPQPHLPPQHGQLQQQQHLPSSQQQQHLPSSQQHLPSPHQQRLAPPPSESASVAAATALRLGPPPPPSLLSAAASSPLAPSWQGRSVAGPKLRLVEFSAFLELQHGGGGDAESYHKHFFVQLGGTPSYSDPLLEAVDIRQIYDKFPEKKGGLKELYDKGPQTAFFLVKFWGDLNTGIQDETGAFYGVTSQYESNESMTIACSTKVCSFGKQVVEKVETEYGRFENGRFVYHIHRSPMCEYMITFVHKLKQLPEKYMMNSVLENFTILQVVTNRDTHETLLCLAYVFEVSTSEHGAQHHVYRLVRD